MSLVHNEKVKLTATYLNGLAIAVFAVGGLAPIVAIVSGTTQSVTATSVVILTSICVCLSAGLHLGARRTLRKLEP